MAPSGLPFYSVCASLRKTFSESRRLLRVLSLTRLTFIDPLYESLVLTHFLPLRGLWLPLFARGGG